MHYLVPGSIAAFPTLSVLGISGHCLVSRWLFCTSSVTVTSPGLGLFEHVEALPISWMRSPGP